MNKEALERMALLIKEKRRVYGYTQEQIAEQLDISYSYYTKIENGADRIPFESFFGQDDLWQQFGGTVILSGCAGIAALYQSV